MTMAAAPSSSVLIWPPAKCRRPSCPRRRGRPPRLPANGPWWAAPWRPVLILRRLNWRRRAGSLTTNPVIPGWSEGPDPESRDSGFASRPGMTANKNASALPNHILRRDQAAAGDQHGRDYDIRTRFGKTGQNQKRGREQRRRVGRGPQHADVAALHPDIPRIERCADRRDAERKDRQPLRGCFRPDRDLDQAVHNRRP